MYIFALFCITVFIRGFLMYSSGSIPGINGAYALAQVQSILDTGLLGVSDLPLTFYIQALIAKICILLGVSEQNAIFEVVRLFDVIIPALSVFGIGLTVSHLMQDKPRKEQQLFTILAIVVGNLSIVMLSMIGDFMKNSFGLVWMSFLFYFIICWKTQANLRNTIGVIIMIALLGITHIGVLGVSGFISICIGIFLVFDKSIPRKRIITLAGVSSIIILIALYIVWQQDPTRVEKLLAFFTGSMENFSGLTLSSSNEVSQGPGGNSYGNLIYLAGGLVTFISFWKQKTLTHRSILLGISLGIILLAGPWISGDTANRFGPMLLLPLSILSAVWISTFPKKIWKINNAPNYLSYFIIFIVGVSSISYAYTGSSPVVSLESQNEIQQSSLLLGDTSNSIIITSHGTEWWSNWFTKADVAQSSALDASFWENYDHVYYLTTSGNTKRGHRNNVFNTLLEKIGIEHTGPGNRPGPLDRNSGDQMGPPDNNMSKGKGGGAFTQMTIPETAQIIYSGESVTIAEISLEEYMLSHDT